jgi:hypothetical protein
LTDGTALRWTIPRSTSCATDVSLFSSFRCLLTQTLGFKSGVCTTSNSLDHCDMVRQTCSPSCLHSF